jgi:hypothetical protein
MPGCCCLNDKGNKILFRIYISPPLTNIAGLDGGQPMAWPPRSPDIKGLIYMSPVDSEEDLTARIVEAAATIR